MGGIRHFNLKNFLSFRKPTNMVPKPMSTPKTPQVSARVAESLNQLKVDLAAAGELPPNQAKPSPILESPVNNNLKEEQTPDIADSKESKAKKASISRPTYKNRLQAYCRERLNF